MLASYQHNRRFPMLIALIAVGLFAVLGALVPEIAFAQAGDFGVDEFGDVSSLGGDTDIRLIIARIIRAIFGILGVIVVGIIVYAGFIWMTSGGSEERIATARKMLINATIGLVIILSAFTITQFVIRALKAAINPITSIPSDETPPPFESFVGSGSLGHIIEDHYPERDQDNVARNTRIVVTFREPMDASSIIANDAPVGSQFGMCREGDDFDWATHCDLLDTESVRIERVDTPGEPVEAAVTIAYEDDEAKIFVFRPLEFLGSDIAEVNYNVTLTNDIKKADGEDAFGREPRYEWEFETGTEFDFSPPFVEETAPESGGSIYRNTILQLTFNEAVDPTLVQGTVGPESPFTNVIFGSEGVPVTGQWQITNGYRTIEFVSDEPCGRNSCGDVMYCLPVGGDLNPYQVLVRTAETLGTTWEALPFTGVADMAGNALDSEPLGVRDGRPDSVPPLSATTPGEFVPDNYVWPFDVRDEIDLSVPHIRTLSPSVDQAGVSEDAPFFMTFSHTMWFSTLEDIALEEYTDIVLEEELAPPSIVKRFRTVRDDGPQHTRVDVRHRDFGPNNLDLFYFASVPGTAKATNQNCMYPGRGPAPAGFVGVDGADGQTCSYTILPDGTEINRGCVPADATDADNDTGCAYTSDDVTDATVLDCLDTLRDASVSPVPTS